MGAELTASRVSAKPSPGQLSLDLDAAAIKANLQAIEKRIENLPSALHIPTPYVVGDLKTKPTLYKGTWYDSRTEAKYALAWDLLGIRYKTEEEKFVDYEGRGFIPDFFLPDFGLWVEVASSDPGSQARKKPRCQALADTTGQPVLLTMGFPGHEATYPLLDGFGFHLPHPHRLNPETVAAHFPNLLRLKAVDQEMVQRCFATARKASFESAGVSWAAG